MNSYPPNTAKQRFIRQITRKWTYWAYLFKAIPSALFSGVRVQHVHDEECIVSVPYSWFSRNPFKSTYFACLAMAGEMSTGVLAMLHIQDAQPKVSMLVTEMEAKYHKKATETTRFICKDGRLIQAAIQYSVSRGQPQTCKAYTVGIDKEGNCIAEFWITWSFKSKQ
jgi:hypothetical protein